MKWLPKPQEVLHEAIIVVAGAILAAVIVGAIPPLKKWLKESKPW